MKSVGVSTVTPHPDNLTHSMELEASEIKSINKIGSLDDTPVYEVVGKGGITYVIVQKAGGKPEMIGAGAHAGIAKYTARKRKPRLVLTELMKSDQDHIYAKFAHEYDGLIDSFNARVAKK